MAESSAPMLPEPDVAELEEAIFAQQQLLQKLNAELDVEREAAASAASEALSMILRLQGEKASLKMEASQYKRMAEEKMCHAEEALAVFEDLIYQREMEIASLEFQVQAYRYRLMSMGCNDLGVYENKFPENLLMQRNDTEKGVHNSIRRLNSQPPIAMKEWSQKKTAVERKRSMAESMPPSPAAEENILPEIDDPDKKHGNSVTVDLNCCWEQIKKLDERVKEFSDNKDSRRNTLWKGGTWSPSLFSQVSIGTSIDAATQEWNNVQSDKVKDPETSQKVLQSPNSACSSNVHDIFEVREVTERHKAKKDDSKLPSKIDKKLGKPDPITGETPELPNTYETDRVKALLLPAGHEKNIQKLRSVDPRSVERCVSPVLQAVTPPELNQLSRRIERLERARNGGRHEIVSIGGGGGEEELKLLKEICQQLKSIQAEMKSLKAKKSLLPLEPSLDPLQEAMLYFWM